MRNHLRFTAVAIVLFFSILVSRFASSAITEPDCSALQKWAGSLTAGATFEPRPGITVNTLFEDNRVVPLFDAPVVTWEREDVSSLQGWLASCRKKVLAAHDRAGGDTLYAAIKEVKQMSRALSTIWSARKIVDQRVDSLLELKPSPDLPEILGIAQAALRGEDVSKRVSTLSPRWQGYGRQAAELGGYKNMLSDDEIVQCISKLEEKRSGAVESVDKRNETHEKLLAEIAAVPVAPEGLTMLNRIAYNADPGSMTREELESYDRAFQFKRRQIQKQSAAQQNKVEQDMVNLTAPVREQVAAVLQGNEVHDISIRGLRPGPNYNEIKAAAEKQWGYGEAISLGTENKQLSTKRKDFNRLMKTERRDGGLLNLRTHSGMVGEISYVEHFPGLMDVAPLKTDLYARFGKPDEEKQFGDGSLSMTWRGGDDYLLVRAGNRVTKDRQFMGVRSSVEITLWTRDFADYLEEAAHRCQKLRDKPVNELSVNEKQALFMNCLTP